MLNNLTVNDLDYINTNISEFENHKWIYPSDWTLSTKAAPIIDRDLVKKNLDTHNIKKDVFRIMSNLFNATYDSKFT